MVKWLGLRPQRNRDASNDKSDSWKNDKLNKDKDEWIG